MNRFVIADPHNCIGCRTCEVACVLAHSANDQLSVQDFTPRIRVVKGGTVSTALLCRHCEDAPCAEVCPNGAIVRRNNSIQVLQEKCIGCKTCAIACPYGVMNVVTKTTVLAGPGSIVNRRVTAQALKCDLCEGKEGGPSCVNVCPTDALRLVTPGALDAMMREKQQRAALETLR